MLMFVAWILIVIFRIILCSNMKRLIGIFCLLVMGWTGAEAERLSLDDAIRMAQAHSPEA